MAFYSLDLSADIKLEFDMGRFGKLLATRLHVLELDLVGSGISCDVRPPSAVCFEHLAGCLDIRIQLRVQFLGACGRNPDLDDEQRGSRQGAVLLHESILQSLAVDSSHGIS